MSGDIKKHKEEYVQTDDDIFIDNLTVLSKYRYLANWTRNVIRYSMDSEKKVLSDRCPYDVAAYVSDKDSFFKVIKQSLDELEALFDVQIVTIYLCVSFDIAVKRVAERLRREPWRARYHEGDIDILRATYRFYEDHTTDWTHVVENNGNVAVAVDRICRIAGVRSPERL